MKITAVSDLHGNLIDIEECTVLLICGDISPLDIQKDYIQMTKWFFNDFYNWICNLPCEYVILTPGNHDFWFEKFIKEDVMYLWNRLTILINGMTEIFYGIKHIKIFGTPYCKTFGNWAFMPGNDKLDSLYDNIPEDIDILICHDSPAIGEVGYIHYDEPINEDGDTKVYAANSYLSKAIKNKKPKYVLSGHIHSGDHELKDYEGIKCANVSILDESYNKAYKPLTFKI